MAWSTGWEYEALFDVGDMGNLSPLEQMAEMDRPERWKYESSGIRKGRMGYRTRTTKAGPRLEAEIYPLYGREETEKARQAKKNVTPEKIRKHNDEKARRKLVHMTVLDEHSSGTEGRSVVFCRSSFFMRKNISK